MENNFFNRFKSEPCIRMAIMSDPEPSELGTGLQKDIIFYGNYDTLADEHRVMAETMDVLMKNGMSRWSIKKVYSPRPIDEDTEIADNPDDRIQYQVKVTVMDPGI